MRQDFRRKTHSNTLSALRQQQGELGGQRDRLLVSAVIAELPICGFRVEYHVEREFRQACLDVSGGGSAVAREDVAPVSLRVDEQVLLSHLHQRIANGSVAVRVELHSVSHDVGHLVETAVVHTFHRVQNASLHRLQTVADMRNGALQNHVAGIVEEPILVHAAQMVHGRSVKAVHGAIVGMPFSPLSIVFPVVFCVFTVALSLPAFSLSIAPVAFVFGFVSGL